MKSKKVIKEEIMKIKEISLSYICTRYYPSTTHKNEKKKRSFEKRNKVSALLFAFEFCETRKIMREKESLAEPSMKCSVVIKFTSRLT